MRQLLMGCGHRRDRLIQVCGRDGWDELTTLDVSPTVGADVVHDLTDLPLPFGDDAFDEIHAYEVLEHTGSQGDYRFFFAQFSEFWRLLRPDGVLAATVPAPSSPWVWGDPSHTRHLPPEAIVFLDQREYARQVGRSPMSDFRYIYQADFEVIFSEIRDLTFFFVLRAVKPSRIAIPQN